MSPFDARSVDGGDCIEQADFGIYEASNLPDAESVDYSRRMSYQY